MVKETFLQKAARVFRLADTEPEADPIPYDKAPAATRPPVSYLSGIPISSVGTQIFAGYYAEEYLEKLRGKQLAVEFDKMRRSDPQVRMLLSAVKNPIKGAKWEIQPGDPDDEASKEIAEHISHILFDDCEKPFEDTVGEILSCVDFGHAVFEPVYKIVFDHPEYGTYHGLDSLNLISQKTIEQWKLDPATGKLLAIQQVTSGDLQKLQKDIPASELILFCMEKEGANYEGVSWLRACYGNWFRKNVYLKLNAIGIEKFAIPTPVVEFPPGEQNAESKEALEEALTTYSSGQSNYLFLPNGFIVKLEKNTYDPELVEISIDREDMRMSKAFCANFLELGVGGNGGAFALSSDLSDFFTAGMLHVANKISNVLNPTLIKYLVDVNFGPQKKYPKLTHSGISDKAGKELVEILGILIDKKVVRPDDPLEARMRKKFDLGEASEEGREDRAPAPPAPFGGAPGADPNQDPEADPSKQPPPGKEPPPFQKKSLSERIYRRLARLNE